MAYRDAIIEYQKTLDDTGTLIKDISIVDPVSAIHFEFEGTNGATSNKGNYLSDVITKIEVVDGSTVLYSLSLAQLEALFFYKTYRLPTLFPSEWADGTNRHAVDLLFGQYLWDDQYNMSFKRYKNPQLKITSNIAAIRAAGATGHLSGYLKATIVAKVMEGLPAAPAYLAAKELESFTSAASGEKRIELPTDYTYRMLMLRPWLQGCDVDEIISNIKLTCDSDKFIPFDRKVKQLDAEALAEYGMPGFKHDCFASDSETVRLLFNKEPVLTVHHWSPAAAYFTQVCWAWSSQFAPSIRDSSGNPYGTDLKLHVHENGHALHATLPVVFGSLYNPDSWFNPRTYGKIESVLTQATASAAVSVVAEQVRPVGS